MTFESFNLHNCIARRVTELGYLTPTPIQERAIPMALEGRDILGLAQTGTGKTAAFALPILERLRKGSKGTPRALIMAPTRELAEQITDDLRSLGKQTGLRYTSIYGGVGQGPQVNHLNSGTDIVVACPGRLLDLMGQGKINLSRIEILVLDEADRMFDMGFLPDIRRIVGQLPKRKQVMLFSATMPAPIKQLAREFTVDPVTIQIGHTAPVETVSHALYPVEPHLKTDLLLRLLERTATDSVLIFTRTKHRAKRLDRHLREAGYHAASLQGNLSQNRRKAAMDGFRDGSVRILVATDIAARGIDIDTISHVINYDVPDTADAYTHRIGRTGRATRNGDAFTLVSPEDEAIVRAIEKVIGSRVERRIMDGFPYHRSAPVRDTPAPRSPRGNGRQQGQYPGRATGGSGGNRSLRPSSAPSGHRGGHRQNPGYHQTFRNRA